MKIKTVLKCHLVVSALKCYQNDCILIDTNALKMGLKYVFLSSTNNQEIDPIFWRDCLGIDIM